MTVRARIVLTLALAPAIAWAGGTGVPASRDAAVAQAQRPAGKAERLAGMYEEFWEESLKRDPTQATVQGDPRYNAALPDYYSAQYRQEEHEFRQRWLQRVEEIGPSGLEGQDLLSYEIFVRNARRALESEQFPAWMLPVHQFGSFLTSSIAQLGGGTGAQPFHTVKDYEDWLARGHRVPVLIDSAIGNMRQGIESGVVQPRVLVDKVLPQLDAIIRPLPEDTVFWGPVKAMPSDFSAADRERLTAAYRDMIDRELLPAYRSLRAFLADEYAPAARTSVGRDALPNGQAWYAFNARQMTTTDMRPDQIHALGLAEVARIHGEIGKVMAQVGFKGTLQEFFEFMRTDPRFTYGSEADLLAHYRALEATISAKVPVQFSLTPKAALEIRPVEAFRAKSASRGQYVPPSLDRTRPGIFYVNTSDLPSRRTWSAEELYLHEAIPGHHFQMALQQELMALPKFRRYGGERAFGEGWGLYAESLGRDLGVYTDPYSYFGSLQNELWRAIRLVVDTGLHSRGWSREQVIAYMLENSATSETDAVAEAERYMAWPGQALAYKIGAMKIQALRQRAQSELGDRFDIRQFHAEVLKDGAVPLDVLEAKVDRWIAEKKKA